MKSKLSNIFVAFGFLLYLIAGIMALVKMNYSIIILLAATAFLAFGFFVHKKQHWSRLFKGKRH